MCTQALSRTELSAHVDEEMSRRTNLGEHGSNELLNDTGGVISDTGKLQDKLKEKENV